MAHFYDAVLQRPDTFNFAVDVVDYWAAQPGDLEAMYWVSKDESQKRSLTFKYFSRQSHRVSVLLQRLGVKQGETMVMIVPRVPAWWEIAVGAIRSGVIISPATVLLTAKDIQYRCVKSKAKVFVGDGAIVAKFLEVRDQCPSVHTVLQVGDVPHPGATSFYASLELVGEDASVADVKRDWKFPALLYFTSGTSGPPKMVRHNQVSYPLAITSTAKSWYQLAPGKLFWNTAEQGQDTPTAAGILHRYPITTMCAAPLAYRQLILQDAKSFYKEFPPKALSHCTAAGEALNDEVIRQWSATTGMEIRDGYGQTETILLCGNFSGFAIRPGSMGKPAPTVPLSIINADGSETAVGEEGEMAVLIDDISGSKDFFGIFDGYLNDDNTVSRREKTFTKNGEKKVWYLTGDKARRDEDGYFWFVGRSDDVINSSGYRIGPFEVESTLKLHPSVVESAVISSPDPIRGEVVKAFVILTNQYKDVDQDSLRKELQYFCKKSAAPYKYPRKIQFVPLEFLPRTVSGKIQRAELRKMEWKGINKAKL
ncbi:hypothetical protein V494_02271 [Pseudogymnoascus sp. VKM F-4513 (FW-928)]|nr:hypothetical protein V494_02271 [Pseudogymnoascus sp. VKM F-4513 (FW-928)]